MKKPLFLPQDFQQKLDFFTAQHVAEIAEDIFESWYKNNIENAPTVYLGKDESWHECDWSECKHTHKAKIIRAKIINVEEIK